ncbi:MAG TPA: hypothetical protein DCG30_00330, partial [Ruminococcus sp.]|nr:hypothetical protein [Ruminococcus sp.]
RSKIRTGSSPVSGTEKIAGSQNGNLRFFVIYQDIYSDIVHKAVRTVKGGYTFRYKINIF